MSTTSANAISMSMLPSVNNDNIYIYCNSTACMSMSDEDFAHHAEAQQAMPQQQQQQQNHQQLEMDLHAYLNFRCYMAWLSLIVIVVGLVGNLISFGILMHPRMRISTNVFLASLCVSGFVALLGLLANSVIFDLSAYYGRVDLFQFLSYFYPYVYPIITTFQMYSILLTVCVSLNQFIYIYYSSAKRRTQKSSDRDCRNALKIVLVMFLLSALFCIPYWLKFRYTRENALHETEIGKNPVFTRIVHFWMYLPIAYFIPLTILIFTNCYLIGTIMLTRRRRRHLGMTSSMYNNNNTQNQQLIGMSPSNNKDKDKEEQTASASIVRRQTSMRRANRAGGGGGSSGTAGMNITIMLIAVVFLFLCCQFPMLTLHIIESMFCDDDRTHCKTSPLYLYAQAIAKFLLICNLSLNFACYCLFSRQFRIVLRETLLPKTWIKENVAVTSTINNTNNI